MSDPELEAIRKQRMAQLQSQYKDGNQRQTPEEAEEKQQQMEAMRHAMLAQILDQSARARLNTLSLGRPETAKMVEDMIIGMAQRGQIMGKMGEKELINILEMVNQKTQKTTTIKFDRRRTALDSDEDDW